MVAALVMIMGEDKAFDYLKKLNPNIQTYTQSGTAPSKAAAIGQAGVGIQFTPAFLQLMGEGYPLKVTFPKEGVGFEAPAISILKGAPRPELAKKLLDWFISPPGQNALTDAKTFFFPVHAKAKLMEGLPAFDQIPTINYDAIWAGEREEAARGPLDQRSPARPEVGPAVTGSFSQWKRRTIHDLRHLRNEPLLGVAVAGIFGLLLLFIVYPLVRVFIVSFIPDGVLTLRLYQEFLGGWFIRQALFNSVVMGVLTAFGGTLIGFLFAFTLTRTDIPGKSFLTAAAILPVISPPFVSALSIILLFGNNGLITRQLLGFQEFAIYGMRGLLLSQVFTFFPVAYLTLRGILESFGGTLEDAAMNLGATRWKAVPRVTLPLCLPGIASALLVLFIQSIADFGNPLILGGSGFPVLSVQVYLQVTGMYDLPGGAALAVILLVPSVTTFLVQRYWVARKRYVTVTGKPTRAVIRAVSPGMQWTLFAACGAVALFVLLFYATIVVGAFSRAWGADHSLTLRNFGYVFGVGAQAIKDTLIIAVTASPLAGLLGMAIAFLVIRRRFPGRQAMEFISILNFAVPGTVIGIGYILAFNQRPLLLTGTALILITNFLFRYIPVGIQSGRRGCARSTRPSRRRPPIWGPPPMSRSDDHAAPAGAGVLLGPGLLLRARHDRHQRRDLPGVGRLEPDDRPDPFPDGGRSSGRSGRLQRPVDPDHPAGHRRSFG